jgi:hypothetical protein
MYFNSVGANAAHRRAVHVLVAGVDGEGRIVVMIRFATQPPA